MRATMTRLPGITVLLLSLQGLVACSSSGSITVKEAQPYWEEFYGELIEVCTGTRTTAEPAPPVSAKPNYYSCEIERYPRQTENSTFSTASPFFGYSSKGEVMRNGLGELLEQRFNAGSRYEEDYFRRYSIKHGNHYDYLQYVMKTGYSLLSYGERRVFDEEWQRSVDILFARVEGYSAHDYPTVDEVLGRDGNVSSQEANSMIAEIKSAIRAQVQREGKSNDQVSDESRAILAERARQRQQEQRAAAERERAMFQQFQSSVAAAMSDSGPSVSSFGASASPLEQNTAPRSGSTVAATTGSGALAASKSSAPPATAQVKQCGPRDAQCIPQAHVVCRDNGARAFDCAAVQTSFLNGMWRAKESSRNAECRTAMGSQNAVVGGGSTWSRNSLFTSGPRWQVTNPKQSCVQECRDLAAKEGFDCRAAF